MEKVKENTVSRKEKRKEERKAKKLKKYLFFSRKYGHSIVENAPPSTEITKPQKKTKKHKPKIKKEKELTAADVRKLQLEEANEEEDKSIKRLEKVLKLNKRKSKNIPKAFAEDGLDYILELIDRPEDSHLGDFDMSAADEEMGDDLSKALGQGSISAQVEQENSDQELTSSESDDGFGEGFFSDKKALNDTVSSLPTKGPSKTSSKVTFSKKSTMTEQNESDYEAFENCSDEIETEPSDSGDIHEGLKSKLPTKSSILNKKQKIKLRNKKAKVQSKTVRWLDETESRRMSVKGEEDSYEKSSEEEDCDPSESTEHSEQNEPNYWEDIYGRLRDTDGNIIDGETSVSKISGKYVPPAKRLKASTDDAKKREVQLRIHKQMRGLLNKLNESNMKHVCDQIENMYMQHSRNDMNEALVHLVQQSVVLPYLTPEKLIMEHALLIAVLHCNIGSEVGAHCLQCLATELDTKLKSGSTYGEGKEVDNLLLLLCHLYTFKISHSLLVYDILKRLTETFMEKDVELILLILRSVGFILRRDDPVELKTVIFSLQSKAAAASHLVDQSRIRFMLDTVMAIRNNNMHKIPNYDPSLAEHLRKALKSFQRKGTFVQELHISLVDLLQAEERGRWWIVGSAWQGVGLHGETESEQDNDNSTSAIHVTPKFSDDVLDLARKQRMNTEVRKNIFCIIMSAEDYMDAFEKLLRLGLKNEQAREFIHVALDCCLQEKQFNPFYAYLAEKFCLFDRKYQMALQFALWDKLKELAKMKTSQVTNLASFLVHLFTRNALPLSVLKVIQLSEMDKVLVKFLRQILLAILLHESDDICRNVFARVAQSPKLQSMREGLRLFMLHFLLRNQKQLETSIAKQLQDRVNIAIDVLNSATEKSRR